MGTCHLCPPDDQDVPDEMIADHVRVLHAATFGDVERWPDGSPVVYDATLNPDDFQPDE